MTTVTIRGASDDLIEIEGDIREEFGANGEAGDLLAFSDGTVLRIVHGDMGIWRITPVFSGSADLSITQVPEDESDGYTDWATLTGDVRWCVLGSQIERSRT